MALVLLTLPATAQNVWTSKIDTFGNFVKQNVNPHANGIVSRFTPAANITVNRIQLQASGGTICSKLPGVKITDGTTTYILPIPNAKADFAPASADSGPISLSYTAGQEIALKAVPGSSGCNPFEINIVVQYSVSP
jgi:hypothetical protein